MLKIILISSYRFLILVAFLSSPLLVNSQVVLTCKFDHLSVTGGIGYGCDLENIHVQRETDRVVIVGNHLAGRSNDDVIRVTIRNSETEFIIQQLFVQFPNMQNMEITTGGLTRIQPNAFLLARNLRTLALQGNRITMIQSTAFNGLTNLDTLILRVNNIQVIDQNAFVGLINLRNLFINNENFRAIHQFTLRPLTNLAMVSLANNQIERIDAQLFANNRHIHSAFLENNQINAIHPQFVNNLNGIQVLSLSSNPCINQVFITRIFTPANMNAMLTRCTSHWQ